MSGALGALGGGIGFGAGKGLQWVAKTKVGEAIMVRGVSGFSRTVGTRCSGGGIGWDYVESEVLG